ncbi:MAG: glycosyltransferase family 2 protein [Methylovirgula sp.]
MNILNPHQSTLAQDTTAAGGSDFRLPLVSVVIVNYNYGRFLNQAVDSVFGQTYPNVECIVVDNASTDESPAVLESISARYPQARIIWRRSNDGQSAASLDGFAAASGAYVIFMDADDILLPQAAAVHMFAHLSLRVHVGFTSGDMLQSMGDQIVISTGEELNRYVLSGKGRRENLLRSYEHAFEPKWPPRGLAESLADKIHFVPHRTTKWVWSPTSGLCYRRDALRQFADNPGLASLRTGTDMYFAHAIGALYGSAIIDTPVFVYRIHQRNEFSRHPQLNRCKAYDGSSNNNNAYALQLLIDHLVTKADRFYQSTRSPLDYLHALTQLDQRDPDPKLPAWRRRSRVAGRLADHYASVAAALGPWKTRALMLRFGVPLTRIAQTATRNS